MTHHDDNNEFNFKDHYDIPPSLREYLVNVADAVSITDIPLDEINEYLNNLEDWIDEDEAHRSSHLY